MVFPAATHSSVRKQRRSTFRRSLVKLMTLLTLGIGLILMLTSAPMLPGHSLTALVQPYHYHWGILLGLWLTAQVVMRLSPSPNAWSRPLIVALILSFALRYFLWRGLTTLNLSDPANTVFSLSLFVLEALVAVDLVFQLMLTLGDRDRRAEADRWQQAVDAGDYQPSVDILIPTYNEPTWILKRTIVGCQAIDYPHQQVYLLDDGRRAEVAELAQKLGCHYLTRPNNRHAKAGNLNHAIAHTSGELIVCFDADFVPTQNFLQRTVGFFQNLNLGLLQTNQGFYNPDLIATNLGIETETPQETEVFSRYYQRLRDGSRSVICYGSSFVVRRSALAAVGNFVTGTVGEDYLTSICLSAQGYELAYLDEKLSAGLVAENLTGHIVQRQRWAKGSFQGLFVPANPLTIPGLNLRQRLTHFDQFIQWAVNFCRLGFLLVPLGYAVFGLAPIQTTARESLYFLLPFYCLQLTAFAWLNRRSRSMLLSDVYMLIECLPIAVSVIDTLLRPFASGFKVTPKGITSQRFSLNWMLALPLLIALSFSLWSAGTLASQLVLRVSQTGVWVGTNEALHNLQLGVFWGVYGSVSLLLALLGLVEVPKGDRAVWFDLHRPVTLQMADQTYSGVTQALSEAGARIDLQQAQLVAAMGTLGQLHIPAAALTLPVRLTEMTHGDHYPSLQLAFEPLSLDQERRLIELLFCRSGQWPFQATPSEGRVLWLLFRSLLRPRWLTGNVAIAPTRVNS
ncbi:MAG: glycosyltransferase [Spirulinaceae cyanobacterium RM2_2_10]|nr:glycosyltransferase [Spirulinaceae cyanobacterium SM2_1_0]NJO20851.1 glycosyltransferase [Spirulinaceae cyanobacterium RM2_2_10]